MKNKIITAVILFVLLAAGIFLVMQKDSSMPTNSNLPAQSTPNSSQQNGMQNDKNLEECLKNASNSDANQEIIKQAQQDCYNRFR